MRSREVRKLFFDVEKACDLVLKFTRGITLDAFLRDEMVQSAVERQSEIIGEALKQAVSLDQTLSERISDVSRIIAFRNRLIHGYASVSPQVVWGIVTNDIPKLLTEIRVVMRETPSHDT
jgi:uncharacterized protein with HEPN domain